MQINYMDDITKKLLCQEEIDEEEYLALVNGIIKNYRKNSSLIQGKKTATEQGDILFENVMKSLPKYAKYFDTASFEECLKAYCDSLPSEIKIERKDYAKGLSTLMDMAVLLQAEVGKYSRNSGVNIDNDKTNYTNSVVDFEMAQEKFTPEFIEMTAAKLCGNNRAAIEAYKEKAKVVYTKMAQDAISDKIEYYTRLTDYLVGFYADNEIARRSEEDYAEAQA